MTGGCQCGAVRYTLGIARATVYACHCRECQRQSGSAFALSLPVRRADVALTGILGRWERATDSGRRSVARFCAACGTRLHHASSDASVWLTIKAGTLDDPSGLVARGHLWTRSKQPWVRLDPQIPAFDTQPTDLAGWRQALIAEADR